jgi:hypothetical protein
MPDPPQYYWCFDHRRVEPADQACAMDRRIGPVESVEAAAHWQDRVDARNEAWEASDRAWDGED